jgi:hypothetical protein
LREKFGSRIFSSKRVVTLSNNQEGFVMPLSRGDYKPSSLARSQGKGINIPLEKKKENSRALLNLMIDMYAEDVVNMDVRGDNVFLDAQGNAMMADFGLTFTKEEFAEAKNNELPLLRKQEAEYDKKLEDLTLKKAQAQSQQEKEAIQDEINELKENFKPTQAKLGLLSGSFMGGLVNSVKAWAADVYRSFSQEEWKVHGEAVKEEFMQILKDRIPDIFDGKNRLEQAFDFVAGSSRG